MIGYMYTFLFFGHVAFKALGKLIFDVGLLVAYHCDQYGKISIVICLALDKGISNWRYSSFLFIYAVTCWKWTN